jgi:hypothetical protein
MLYYTILYYDMLYYTILYYDMMYYTVLAPPLVPQMMFHDWVILNPLMTPDRAATFFVTCCSLC